jgi:hypothetical protein
VAAAESRTKACPRPIDSHKTFLNNVLKRRNVTSQKVWEKMGKRRS